MKNQKGISMIALVITIIVIIILAVIVFIASGDQISNAQYATFAEEFGDYQLNFQNDALAEVKMKYGVQGQALTLAQAVYMAADPKNNTMENGVIIPAGVEFVTELNTLVGTGTSATTRAKKLWDNAGKDVTAMLWGAMTDGTVNNDTDVACWEIAGDAIDQYSASTSFYGNNLGTEKHFVTENGFVFTLPGYPREVDGELRMYISPDVFYLADNNHTNVVSADETEDVGAHHSESKTRPATGS